jgi:electron transfer flavoprotein alpha/beta subunit
MDRKGAAIAARIRGLIAGQAESLEATARLLGVDEIALRISLDELAPYPTVEVIAAVVAKYGVDPCWLLTGEYNSEVHRAMLEFRTDELPSAINRLVESPGLPRTPAFKTPSRGMET